MATPIHVPKINNNDDEVKLIGLQIAVGTSVSSGQIIAQIETDKAVIDVESPAEGFILAIYGEIDSILKVGDIFVWIGETPEEAVPEQKKKSTRTSATAPGNTPTAKAQALLHKYGLNESEVLPSGERLSAADVLAAMASRNLQPVSHDPAVVTTQQKEEALSVSGALKTLKSEERGMPSTVLWHRDVAVPGYIELSYDQTHWKAYSESFGKEHGLLLSPLLPLMAWRLVELGVEIPRLNATISGSHRYEYDNINLGFTVQAGDTLYLVVVQNANTLDELAFVNKIVELQRSAAGHKLGPQELQNTTVSFSSMARWKVGRHIPVLPPHTAIMIAHTVDSKGQGILGATYDHRVLHGGDVVNALRKLGSPNNTK